MRLTEFSGKYNHASFLVDPYAAKVSTMRKAQALKVLKDHKSALAEDFGVIRLALFGSTVRDSAGPDSDIDILVKFDGPATSARYFGVQFYLEDLLGQSVDLVTDKALREELRPFIEREAVNVW
jgi:predicted nucleotidyltransferase